MKPTALFSLHDTTDAAFFAARLIRAGWDIIGSAETVALLRAEGLPVRDIADYTGVHENYGFPPTMHPKVEKAITGKGPGRIDLVYVIPYPLSVGNDVGGRALLGFAVKGGRIAVMDVADMRLVVAELAAGAKLPAKLHRRLADKACHAIAGHYWSLVRDRDDRDAITGRLAYGLQNGENPYQCPAAAFVAEGDVDPLSLLAFKRVSGEAPCFTNAADADSILHTICLADEAFRRNTGASFFVCVAAKHGNACGLGSSRVSPAKAIDAALFGNPLAIWGGEVATNFPIDKPLAERLLASPRRAKLFGSGAWMLDLVMAPGFTKGAVAVLGKRQARKLLENPALRCPTVKGSGFAYRAVRGGFLRQPPATYILDLGAGRQAGPSFSPAQLDALIVAWAAAFSANHGGNEIALAKNGVLLGAGGGPSTLEAVRIAVQRALDGGHDPAGAAFAADAFFPFTDAPKLLCEAGITCGCVPQGGGNHAKVKAFFTARSVAVAFLPERIRGFCRH